MTVLGGGLGLGEVFVLLEDIFYRVYRREFCSFFRKIYGKFYFFLVMERSGLKNMVLKNIYLVII